MKNEIGTAVAAAAATAEPPKKAMTAAEMWPVTGEFGPLQQRNDRDVQFARTHDSFDDALWKAQRPRS